MVHRLYRYSLLTYLIIRVEHFKLDKLPKCNALCELCSHPICEHIFKHFLSNFVSRRKIYIETSENVIGNVKVTKNFSSHVGGLTGRQLRRRKTYVFETPFSTSTVSMYLSTNSRTQTPSCLVHFESCDSRFDNPWIKYGGIFLKSIIQIRGTLDEPERGRPRPTQS